MIQRKAEFPEYGSGGDYAGARRSRRAFRYAVAAAVLFTGGLWLTEQYLRYDETERHYLLALTSEAGPARVHLRQAIKIDADTAERPTSKYLIALAEREEEDKRLRAFETAYQADPANSFLAMRYGCELFNRGEARRSHDLFARAYEHPPQNALPLYLEAATLPFIEADNPHLDEAFQIIQRANTSGDPLVFQRPLWFSTLPEDGDWYARLGRQVAGELLAPIQQFAQFIVGYAEQDLHEGTHEMWQARLAELHELGARILRDSQPEVGARQAVVGLSIQLDAARLQARALDLAGQKNAGVTVRQSDLSRALEAVTAFELQREELIAGEKTKLQLPIELIWQTTVLLGAIYLVTYSASRLLRARRQSWTLAHSIWAKVTVLTMCSLLFMLLLLLNWLQSQVGSAETGLTVVAYAWFAIVGIAAVFGAFYPAFMLPLPNQVVGRRVGEGEDYARVLTMAKRSRRIAYVSLMRRYYGILLGFYIIMTCVWVIGFRVFNLLYAWQIKLLVPGLVREELEVVRRAVSMLS